jgi:uncharacterized protein YceH (UPF0502 family)
MEKSLSTPDYYPLSLNALKNACNQKSSRDPVVFYNEETVLEALDQLKEKELVQHSDASRVLKFEELLSRQHSLLPRETGTLSVLLLRGPQTVGEIRSRTSRMCRFESTGEVSGILDNLEELGLIKRLARLAGHKESRYAHLFSDEPLTTEAGREPSNKNRTVDLDERVDALEKEVIILRSELEAFKTSFEMFKKQFE